MEDIAYVASGSTPSKSCFVENGIPYLKMYNLRNQKIDFAFHPQYINEETHKGKLARSIATSGDLIMNIVGPPLGKLAIIPDSIKECNFNQAAVMISPYLHKNIVNKYLFYYLSEMSEINSIITKGSAGQVNISLTQSQNMRIPLPPLLEQKRIIAEIEKWFTLIDEIEKGQTDLAALIEQGKSKVLDLAIHGKLVPQDPADEPAIDLLRRINPDFQPCDTSHYKNLPQGWSVCQLADIANSELGKTLDKEKNTGTYKPYLCAMNVLWNSFDLTNVKEMRMEENEEQRYLLKAGDLLICEGGEVGRCAIWERVETMFYQNALHRVRFIEGIDPHYFLYLFKHYHNIGLIATYSKGMTIKHFTKTALNTIPLVFPPINEQRRIVNKIKEIFSSIDSISQCLAD